MNKNVLLMLSLSGALFSSGHICAQDKEVVAQEISQDDLGNVTDEFQEYFFEALKQKGIENYEKALKALRECEELEPENAVVYFEKARNYTALENYEQAILNLKKSHELAPEREDVLNELYKNYTRAERYPEAILSLKKLIEIYQDYKQQLANLYLLNQQYDKALQTIEELDKERGSSSYRNKLRRQIYARTGNIEAQITNLEKAINQNPENEKNYLNLIYIYSDQGNNKDAYNTALKLQKTIPGSNLVHLALYKFYLDREEPEEAVNSMKIVFESEEIDAKSKYKVLNDFLRFVNNNPEYEDELMAVSKTLRERENVPKLYEQLGVYYMKKGENEDALNFLKEGLADNPNDFELIRNILFLQLELEKYEETRDLSEEMLEVFPTQPVLYLFNGIALNKLEEFNEAIEILTFGLDYLIGNSKMKIDFYSQLSLSHEKLGNNGKSEEYRRKVDTLIRELQ